MGPGGVPCQEVPACSCLPGPHAVPAGTDGLERVWGKNDASEFGFRGPFFFTTSVFSSDAEWLAIARPGVASSLAGLVSVCLSWGQTCWAGVGLVGVVLGQCCTGWASIVLVEPVPVQLCWCLASASGWQEVEEQDRAMGRAQQGCAGEGALGALSRSVVVLKHFIKCFLSWEGLDYPGSFCFSNSLSSSTKAPQEQPASC